MTTWQIDSAHTSASFTAKHLMVTKVRGIFKDVTGSIDFDEDDWTKSAVEVSIPTATVSTNDERRDGHLRSADFLDVEQHPTMTFRSTSIVRKGDRWAIGGDLTIRGTTRPVVLDAEHLGIVKGMTGARHAGFEAQVKIKRADWGLTWNMALESGGFLVSDEVQVELEVAADEVVAVPTGESLVRATA